MDNNFERALSELKSIDAQIEKLKKRKDDLAQFIELHNRLFHSSGSEVVHFSLHSQGAEADSPALPAKVRIERACKEILADDVPRQTRALLDELCKRGIEVGGQDKVLALSKILSSSDDFEVDRKIGWSLKKERSSTAATVDDLV